MVCIGGHHGFNKTAAWKYLLVMSAMVRFVPITAEEGLNCFACSGECTTADCSCKTGECTTSSGVCYVSKRTKDDRTTITNGCSTVDRHSLGRKDCHFYSSRNEVRCFCNRRDYCTGSIQNNLSTANQSIIRGFGRTNTRCVPCRLNDHPDADWRRCRRENGNSNFLKLQRYPNTKITCPSGVPYMPFTSFMSQFYMRSLVFEGLVQCISTQLGTVITSDCYCVGNTCFTQSSSRPGFPSRKPEPLTRLLNNPLGMTVYREKSHNKRLIHCYQCDLKFETPISSLQCIQNSEQNRCVGEYCIIHKLKDLQPDRQWHRYRAGCLNTTHGSLLRMNCNYEWITKEREEIHCVCGKSLCNKDVHTAFSPQRSPYQTMIILNLLIIWVFVP